MERICYTFDLVPGKEADYQKAHAEISPDVIDAMHDAGIENYTLFRRGTHVIAYGECTESIDSSLASLGASSANERWKAVISGMFRNAFDENGEPLLAHEIWRLPNGQR